MTSSNGNNFRVTGHLCGEFTGHRWIPRTKASDAEFWCFLWSASEKRLSKQSRGWWFETSSRSLWRQRNGNQPHYACLNWWLLYHQLVCNMTREHTLVVAYFPRWRSVGLRVGQLWCVYGQSIVSLEKPHRYTVSMIILWPLNALGRFSIQFQCYWINIHCAGDLFITWINPRNFIMDVITDPCSDGKSYHVSKRSPTMLHKKIVVYNSSPWGLIAYCVLWGISKWGVLSYFETSSSNFWRNIYIFSKLVSNTYWWYFDISMHFWCLLFFLYVMLVLYAEDHRFIVILETGPLRVYCWHYDDVIMSAIASQITSLTMFYSIVYSDANQRKYQSSVSLAFVRGIHRGPVNSQHKWPVTRRMFPFDDVMMEH